MAPLKAELQEKSAKAQAAQESLAKTSKELEEKKELFVKLKQDLAAAESQKKKFTQEIERTEKEIERARDLLDLLKNENKRWSDQGLKFQEKYKNFLGDMIISSGIIAYLGVFPESYRTACIKSWCELLTNFGITKSENFSLYDTLYDPIEIFLWKKEKLPTNETSIQNAIIMEKSEIGRAACRERLKVSVLY